MLGSDFLHSMSSILPVRKSKMVLLTRPPVNIAALTAREGWTAASPDESATEHQRRLRRGYERLVAYLALDEVEAQAKKRWE